MIPFACQQCGRKFKVKEEFAGRSTRCPACKQALVVPDPSRTEAYVPKDQIDGPPSSLDQAGTDAGVSLPGSSRTEQKPLPAVLAGRDKAAGRYLLEGEIARGGMGAVLRGIDRDLRREVAIKFMLSDKDARQRARFIEEAQITGQLEHPNIVPIHELGVDAQKRLFFTMKMVKGRSLAQILDDLSKHPESAKEWTLSRLLNIVVNICHALGYAHSRHVIHRDLKPANIMVGDFGEVYVMDWGLAKVLSENAPSPKAPTAAFAAKSLPPTAKAAGGSVSTNRDTEGDLTQDGSILGTPAYMPPEQAHGNIQAIDQRSDIYSLGAILYAVLTLKPPVEKDGNAMAILMRVAEGNIKKPEERTPERYIPPELSAICMKALAKEPSNRYPTAEAFRRDLELFLEGHSVSAKQDTIREQVWKLVKRNKGASLATAAAFVVLVVVVGFFLKINYNARVLAESERNKANDNYTAFKNEQEEKRQQAIKSVPALVRSARMMVNDGQFDDALAQATLAVGIDGADANARLQRGQLLIGEQDYPAAQAEFQACLKQTPDNAAALKLLKLCETARTDNSSHLLALADELSRQKAFTLGDKVTQQAEKLLGSRKELLAHYQKRLDTAWPGAGKGLQVNAAGEFSLQLTHRDDVIYLGPLQGMKLTSLKLNACRNVRDLAPLKGMPLTSLTVQGAKELRDLTPLQGMRLTRISLAECQSLRDLSPLQGMPLTFVDLFACFKVDDLTPLQGMKLTHLNLSFCYKWPDLGPIKGMPITILDLAGWQRLRDLETLKGMPLTYLNVDSCHDLKSLDALKQMRLESLRINGCKNVRELGPLQGMPIKKLWINGTGVNDLTPLQGMALQSIMFTPKNITQGLDIVRQMKSLQTIGIDEKVNAKKEEWPAAEFWKKYDAGEFKK